MSELFYASMTSLTLVTGADVSRDIDFLKEAFDAEAIAVKAPADIDSKTYTWEGSVDRGVTYATIKDTAGNSVLVPAINTMIIYNGVFTALTNLRLKASGVIAGANVVFQIAKNSRS